MGELDGRVAIVAGAGAGDGIGAATVRRFVAEGYRVLATDRSGRAENLVQEPGVDRVAYLHVDLGRPEDAVALVGATAARWGRLDMVVANAGVMPTGSVATHTLEGFRLALEETRSRRSCWPRRR